MIRKTLPFLAWWPRVNASTLRADLLAGLVGAIVVLPQAIAFGSLAGVGPEYGLYCAMVPAVVAALFGSSWHAVSGPTNAVSLVLVSTLAPLAAPGSPSYIGLSLTVAFLSGIVMIAMGAFRLGTLVNFISNTVLVGFTAGAALLIASSQLGPLFGIDINPASGVLAALASLARQFDRVSWPAFAVGAITVAAGLASQRFLPRVPHMIVAIVAGSVAALAWNDMAAQPLRMLQNIPSSLPPLSHPDLSLETIRSLSGIAIAVTMISVTQAMSICRAVALKSHQRIDADQEFIGLGLSNIAASFFSGFATGTSLNRTGLNYESGAKTPLAALASGVLLVLIVLFFAPLVSDISEATLAGLLFLVAAGLVDARFIRHVFSTSRAEAGVLAVSFAATLLLPLDTAILAGVVFSLLTYLNRTSHPALRSLVPDPHDPDRKMVEPGPGLAECPQMKILRIEGSLYFGAVEHVARYFDRLRHSVPGQKHLLVMAKSINTVDLAGADLIVHELRRRRREGGDLYLYSLRQPVVQTLERTGYLEEIGSDHCFRGKRQAFRGVFERLDRSICRRCTARIFEECHGIPGPETSLPMEPPDEEPK